MAPGAPDPQSFQQYSNCFDLLNIAPTGPGMAGDAGDGGATPIGDAAPGSCASALDCELPNDGPAVACCLGNACVSGYAAATATAGTPPQNIVASSYDQSCQQDSDCILIPVGDFSKADGPEHGIGAINKSACARFLADFAKTTAAACWGIGHSEMVSYGSCCRHGVCGADSQCAK
jgi:hypothetical protein